MKEEKEEKLAKWMGMSFEEKQKYNGWEGFLKNERFAEANAFMRHEKEKLKRKSEKEKRSKLRKKENIK